MKGRFATDFEDMARGEKFFVENFHMSKKNFEHLFSLIEKDLVPKRNTRPKDAITAKLKLALVIEYLASGDLQRHLASCYRVSKQHMGAIVDSVCNAICHALCPTMKELNAENFLNVANGFNKRWNFPNCIGAIDGKHVAIKAPANAGSVFYNYKGFHSLVLLAVCDATYRFTYVDVGAYGSEGDCNIFRNSQFGRNVLNDRFPFPANAMLNGVSLPFFFVADDAFPLCKRIMKPFNNKNMPTEEVIYNYRLSRARRCIENAFGLLCTKWACLKKTLYCGPDRAQKIMAACCMLHNF
ncbi:putative nuclease HARBI1 [Armigeres subalbatus]|uniref:putative nuclease HARBI1 n=1 Tax=Armigeres subalbatus TaxID=124917 RepID=UPI002ED0E503